MKTKLDDEIRFIIATLCNNAYPLDNVESIIKNKISVFNKIKLSSVQKCTVYLRLPWLGSISNKLAKPVSILVEHCYFAANTCMFFSAMPVVPSMHIDVLSPQHSSSLIYLNTVAVYTT